MGRAESGADSCIQEKHKRIIGCILARAGLVNKQRSVCVLDIFTVSFFGHSHIEDFYQIETQLDELIRKLLAEKEYVDFLVGKNGDFDRLVSSAIRRVKRTYRDDNSCHILVLPYPTAEYRDNEEYYHEFYDEVEVCGVSMMSHYKAAIQKRNREMVDRSDLVICFVARENSGAYQTVRYAEKIGKSMINLANTDD